jgi:PadR family transcriptional regulator, regulatory protein PadR
MDHRDRCVRERPEPRAAIDLFNQMSDQDLYSGLIRLHVLYHASRERIFGLGMMKELQRHGYRIGPGTLYPILHRLEEKGYLVSQPQTVAGKRRRSYAITRRGRQALKQASEKVKELFDELFEGN